MCMLWHFIYQLLAYSCCKTKCPLLILPLTYPCIRHETILHTRYSKPLFSHCEAADSNSRLDIIPLGLHSLLVTVAAIVDHGNTLKLN